MLVLRVRELALDHPNSANPSTNGQESRHLHAPQRGKVLLLAPFLVLRLRAFDLRRESRLPIASFLGQQLPEILGHGIDDDL